MGLADARAMYPSLPVVEADFEADRRLLEAIADWCDRYTPLVGLDPPDGLLLDVTGCAHLFGGESGAGPRSSAPAQAAGFAARAAVADTVGCAWGVARYGGQGIVPRGETEAAALPLPIAALRVDAETVAGLKTAGLTCVADLATRPRAPFAARFGEMLVRRLDQALGREDEPITPRLPVPAAMAEQRFPEPIAREADVLGTIEHLARQLAVVLERRGEGGRLFQVALFRADGKVHRLEIGTGAPLRDPARVRKLFEERLAVLGDACDPGFGYDMVRLSALVTERSDPAQTGLAGPDHAEELAHLIDRLGARFGLRRVTRLVPQDTHIPEYAVAAVPAHAARRRRLARCTDGRAGHSFRHSPAASVCPAGTDRSHRRRCRTVRRCDSPGGTSRIRSRRPKARSASPWNGGATTAATSSRAIISASRAKLARGCGFIAKASTAARRRESRAGICTACLREHEIMSAYAELAVTTNFSFLRGASKAEELVLRAKELGLVGLGIADRNSVAGVVRAHAMAKVIGFKLAVGARLVFSDGSPDILAYPEDRAAWGRLTRLLTVGKDRAEKGDCILGLPDLLEEAEGLNLIVMPPARINSGALIKLLRRLKETSRRSVWLAASLLYRGDDRRRLAKLQDVADGALVPLIAVNDVLYHVPERRALQDVVTCIREHRTLEEAGTSSGSQCRAASEIRRGDDAAVWRDVQGHRPDDALPQALPVLVG